MKEVLQKLSPPIFSLVLLVMGSALFSTFVSLRLEAEGFSKYTVGMVAASMYAGILIGSIYAENWIQRWGHLRSFAYFIGTIFCLIVLQSMWMHPIYWACIRFVSGLCMAGIFVVVESWLLLLSPKEIRGRILSLYLAIFYGGLSLGQLLIHFCDPLDFTAFWITGFLTALALVPLKFCYADQPKMENSIKLNLFQIVRLSPLGFLGGLVSGSLLAAIYGLVPLYGKLVGLKAGEIGNLMAMIVFGGLSLQWPLGRLADRSSRKRVLNGSAIAASFFALTIAFFGQYSMPLLLGLGWLFGGFAFTIYPLSMAYTCEVVKEEEIIAATGGFVLSYGIGAVFGPLAGPLAMHALGSEGLFYFLGTIAIFIPLFSWAGNRLFAARGALKLEVVRKESPSPDDKASQDESKEGSHLNAERDHRDRNEG
jgi:MFS family permease